MGCQGSVVAQEPEEWRAQDAMVSKAERMVADRIKELCVPDSSRAARISSRNQGPYYARDRVVVSFPGVHGRAWNHLYRCCNQMDGIKTSCVFLPSEESPGYGEHLSMTKAAGFCHCVHLYEGKQQEFGCKWWGTWQRKTDAAAGSGAQLYVVTKKDGSLGISQKSEVRYLKDKKYSFKTMTIEDFVAMVAAPVVAPLRERRNSLGERPSVTMGERRSSLSVKNSVGSSRTSSCSAGRRSFMEKPRLSSRSTESTQSTVSRETTMESEAGSPLYASSCSKSTA